MRILLALITVFAVFQAQAYCYITDKDTQPSFHGQDVTLDLDVGKTSEVKNINFDGSAPAFYCLAGSITSNDFTLSVPNTSSYYYLIENGIHNLFLRISLQPQAPVTSQKYGAYSTHNAAALNSLQYKLEYSIQSDYKGSTRGTIKMNDSFLLGDITIKPRECSSLGCIFNYDNKNHKYTYQVYITPKFTPTTCTFKDQDISAQDISYHEIDSNGFAAPKGEQPQLQCSSLTGVATSNIHYHFESISMAQNTILKNDLETQQGGAGEVGFELMNDKDIINFPTSKKFILASRGNTLRNNTLYPLNLKLRYARYGNKVFAGRVQSKVKVVVDYD